MNETISNIPLRKRFFLVLVFVVVFFMIVGFFYFFNKRSSNRENDLAINDQEARETQSIVSDFKERLFLHDSSSREEINKAWEDYLLEGEKDKALEDFYSLTKENTNQIDGQALLYLSIVEIESDRKEIRRRGIKRLMDIVINNYNNGSIKTRQRAIAFQRLAELNFLISDDEINDVLENENFNKNSKLFLLISSNRKNSDFRHFSKKLIENSETLHPTPSNVIESLYFDLENYLVSSGKNQASRKEVKNLNLENRLRVLDSLVFFIGGEENIGPYRNQFCPDRLFYYYLYKALFYNRLMTENLLINEEFNLGKNEIEKIYQKNIELIGKYPILNNNPYRYEHFIRFYYAIFLNNAYGQSRAEDIRKLLDPIYQMKGNSERGIFVFLQKEKAYPDNYPHKQEILKLTQVDPRMRDMLISAGWEVN